MTAGVVYINGRRISISAVTARTLTTSKDTYVDILDNGDGTGTLAYTEVTNNTASPALAANSIRIAIVVTGASNIAAATSINQGQETMVLPIASSIPYAVTDSLGNLICPRDPNRKVLGYRQRPSAFTFTTNATITELVAPVIVPVGRKIKVTVYANSFGSSAPANMQANIYDGATTGGTVIGGEGTFDTTGGGFPSNLNALAIVTPTTANKTYSASASASAGTGQLSAISTSPMYILIELE